MTFLFHPYFGLLLLHFRPNYNSLSLMLLSYNTNGTRSIQPKFLVPFIQSLVLLHLILP